MSSDALPGADAQHATGVSEELLRSLLDAVRTDPYLNPIERETSLGWTGADSSVDFYSEDPVLITRFLLHPEARVESVRVTDPPGSESERFGARMNPEQYQRGLVTGVRGEVPIGALKVGTRPRSSSNAKARVISDLVLDNDPRGSKEGDDA